MAVILVNYSSSTLITPKKLCVDCKHFISSNRECSKFGETDLVSGKNDYIYASSARKDKNKCGDEAKYFDENKFKLLSKTNYFLISNLPFLYIFWIYLSLMCLAYRISHI